MFATGTSVGRPESLTAQAHRRVAEVLRPGDLAVDATAGNGHDTCFLAECVGEDGHVWAFDIQATAIRRTRLALEQAGLAGRVSMIAAGHQRLAEHLDGRGPIRAIMFNLGYLPGGDKRIVTQAGNTISALEQSLASLAPDGLISLLIYRGHSGGREESDAITRWLRGQPMIEIETTEPGDADTGPCLLFLRRRS
jgi:predicted methyltransferase